MVYDTYSDIATPSMSGEEIHSVWEQEDNVIDHVIFVIHGIGQQTERFGYFEQHMETIRSTICEVLQARMPYRDIRIQLIPIEWHKHIHEQTDPCLENISLSNIPGMRLVSNDYIMDALYYLAKDRQQSIINHVTATFNEAYHDFMDAHPTFQGNIGIFGYSLGGLITWDILAHQRPVQTMEEQAQRDKLDLNVPHLDFKPQFLFGVGCPLGAFLNIRNQDPKLYRPADSTIFENIYHPYDPLAYRLEPLYHPDCRQHESVQVETAISNDNATPLFSSLTGWVTSWFKRSTDKPIDDNIPSCTPQQPSLATINTTTTANNTTTINTNTNSPWIPQPPVSNTLSLIATTATSSCSPSSSSTCSSPISSDDNSNINNDNNDNNDNNSNSDRNDNATYNNHSDHRPLSPPSPIDHLQDGEEQEQEKMDEPTDRTTLLSSVGALFQYISPRASFDRDSAIGSDIEEDEEDHQTKTKRKHASMSALPPPVASSLTMSMNDPNMYRRRQSQICDAPQFWMQKKRRQSLPNVLQPAHRQDSSLERDTALLQTLPGCRRVDYALQPGPLFGGMISNQYLVGLQAHFSYWNNKDMMWHMVDQLDNAIH